MSLPVNEHSDLSAPSLPAPGAAPTLTAPQPTIDSPSLPAPGGLNTTAPSLPSTGPQLPEGDLPRLGAPVILSAETTLAPAPTATPTPAPTATTATTTGSPGVDLPSLPSLPSLPTVSPVLTSPSGLPVPGDTHPADDGDTDASDTEIETAVATTTEPAHPMAHLMPEKAAPSEASRKAAEIRAAKKAKAKRIKLGVTAGLLVVTVVVGPPLWSWLTNAINESGSTSTEQPAD